MLRIAFWLPGLGVVKDIQHIRYHLKKHHYFIEMIKIISYQKSVVIDICLGYKRL